MSDMPPLQCDLAIRVRYPESDPMGYLHHSKFFEYFEMGRIELLRQAGFSYRDLEAQGCFMAVVKIECRFKSPGRFDDALTLTTRIERMTRARIDHVYHLRRDGVELCEARSTIACVDAQGKLQPIPEEIFIEIGD